MQSEFVPKSKFSEKLSSLCGDYVFLALVAFAISFIDLVYFGDYPFILKILIGFVPALIYTIKTKSIAKPTFVLAFTLIYVCLYCSKLCCWTLISAISNHVDFVFMFMFVVTKVFVFTVYEFICSFLVFWITNLLTYGILKLSKKTAI